MGQLETGMEEVLTSEEELAILREFDEETQAAPAQAKSTGPARTPPAVQEAEAPPVVEPVAEKPPSAAPDQKARPTDAEPT